MNNFICGGGIAGLLCSYYLPDYRIVSAQLGGQNSEDFSLGPRLIKVDKYTTKLLQDLQIDATTREYKVGYKTEAGIFDTMPVGFREKYVEHTRELDSIEESHLSSGQNTILCYDFDYQKLVKILIEKAKEKGYIAQNVSSISTQSNRFIIRDSTQTQLVIVYDNLISTLPLPLFYKLSRQPEKIVDFKAFDTSFIKVRAWGEAYAGRYLDFDYLYLDSYMFHRLTFLSKKENEREFILEYKGQFTIEMLDNYNKIFSESHVDALMEEIKTIPNCQIQKSKNVLEDSGVRLCGRYAQWSHPVKINELLKSIHERFLNG